MSDATQAPDMVNSPPHYAQQAPECIDAMVLAWGRERVAFYCDMAAFKYGWRAGHKGSAAEDWAKRQWYLEMAAHLRGHGPDPRVTRGVKSTPALAGVGHPSFG